MGTHLMKEPLSNDTIFDVYERQMGICLYCKEFTEILEGYPHRVIPKHLGGEDVVSNLVWCCNECAPHIRGESRIAQGLHYLKSMS